MDSYEQCLQSFRDTNHSSIYYLVESISFQKGLEGPYHLIKHYTLRDKHSIACMYWNAVQNIPDDEFTFLIAYYVAISAKATSNIELTAQMCLKLFQYKQQMQLHMLDTIIQNVRYVLPFCRPPFLEAFQQFLLFVQNTHHLTPDYKPTKTHSILFYVGGVCPPWNYTYGLTNAVGGSENAIRYLTRYFGDYNVYVCGNVIEEDLGNVHYVKKERLGELIMDHHFDSIILSRDLSFLDLCPTHYTDSHLIMAHDIELYNIPNTLKYNIPCVCLTNFHQTLFQKYNLSTTIIPNGIQPQLFLDKPKIHNRFIFTSCSERGLAKLIQLWPSILDIKPDATLIISSYQPFPREHDLPIKQQIELFPSIQHVGQLNPTQLYEYMATAHYWLFPSNFLETSCITALEMMASKVNCMFYPIGGIVDTMHGYGIPMKEGDELHFQDYDLDAARDYALSCTWESSAQQWIHLIRKTIHENKAKAAKELAEKELAEKTLAEKAAKDLDEKALEEAPETIELAEKPDTELAEKEAKDLADKALEESHETIELADKPDTDSTDSTDKPVTDTDSTDKHVNEPDDSTDSTIHIPPHHVQILDFNPE